MAISDREDVVLIVLHLIIFLLIKNRLVYIQNTHLCTQPKRKRTDTTKRMEKDKDHRKRRIKKNGYSYIATDVGTLCASPLYILFSRKNDIVDNILSLFFFLYTYVCV